MNLKKFLGLTLALCFIFLLIQIPVYGDGLGAPPPRYLDVQGAKIVSEGAYFYFEVKNIGKEQVDVIMHTPLMFEEFNQYDTYGGFSSGNQLSIYVPFTLDINQSVKFHFHAPLLEPLRWDDRTGKTISGEYYRRIFIEFIIMSKEEQQTLKYPILIVSLIAWKYSPESLAKDEILTLRQTVEYLKRKIVENEQYGNQWAYTFWMSLMLGLGIGVLIGFFIRKGFVGEGKSRL